MRSRIAALLWLLGCQAAFAQGAWPTLQGGAGVAGCQHALDLGQAAFRSNTFAIEDWSATPVAGATVVLRIGDEGAYGDQGIVADSAVFTPMRNEGEFERLHWAQQARGGVRLVVVDYEHSWRGYNYEAFAIPENMAPTMFRNAMRSSAEQTSLRSFTGMAWRPPIVLRDDATGALFVISLDTGALEDWRVFDQSGEQRCSVRFRPESMDPLPHPVRRLAQQIDATLGEGRDEGTLQPTARIRFTLSQTWADIALRPWALNALFVTPRPLVDAGLRRWSRQAPSFRAAYATLIAQYPRAQQALELHYRRAFHLPRAQARELAAYALDFALRSAYHFSGTGDASAPANSPWPADVPHGA